MLRCSWSWTLAALALASPAAAPQAGAAAREAWQDGRREQAVELARAALSSRPDDLELRRTVAGWQMAIHHYAGALGTARGQPSLSSTVGHALYLLGRYEEALQQLSADDPFDVVLRVDACEALGDDVATEAALDRADELALGSGARLASARGRLLARAGRHGAAAERFAAALELDPLLPGAHFGLGRTLVSRGRHDEALVVLGRHRELVPLIDQRDAALRALDLAPRHAPNHAQLGDVERALGRLGHAQGAYERAGRLATPEQLVPIVLRLSRLLADDSNDLAAAVTLLDDAGRRVPDARLAVRAGDLLALAARWPEAVERFEQAQQLRPSDPRIAERLARARSRAEP